MCHSMTLTFDWFLGWAHTMVTYHNRIRQQWSMVFMYLKFTLFIYHQDIDYNDWSQKGVGHVIGSFLQFIGEFPACEQPAGVHLVALTGFFLYCNFSFRVFHERAHYHFALSNVEIPIWCSLMGALDCVKYSWIRAPGRILSVTRNHSQRHT